jgi:hypothetical protein
MRNAALMWLEVQYRANAAHGPDWAAVANNLEDNHDPADPAYASMTRDQLAEGMDLAFKVGNADGAFLVFMQHFLDRCSTAELAYEKLGRKITEQIGKRMIGGEYMYPPERYRSIMRRVFNMLDDVADEFGGEGTELAKRDDDATDGGWK